MRKRFESAFSFPAYLETVRENEEMWRGVYRRVKLPHELVEDATTSVSGPWHLLALTEDWCGDAVNSLPVVARLAEALPDVDLRVLPRDENLDIMDAHLTNGRSRSIPIVILLDENFEERDWWGPRPTALQQWMMDEGLKMETENRYREARRFYARDKGRSTLEEVIAMMKSAETAAQ